MAHALLSPSSAHRWLVCPGSVVLTKDLPEQQSAYAEEGSRAHELAADALQRYTTITDEQLLLYVNFVRDIARGRDKTLIVEHQVDLESITGEAGAKGTADAIVFGGGVLHVIDLKWGRGVQVESEGNPQLAIYALGALDSFGWMESFEKVRMTIVQPRLSAHPITWELTVDELEAMREKFRDAAALARDMVDGIRAVEVTPSEKGCKFCRARGSCKAFAKVALEAAGVECPFEAVEPESPLMTDADKVRLLKALPVVEAWVSQFSKSVLEEALSGKKFEGFKLVSGRAGARSWVDDDEAAKMLAGMKLTQAERYVKKLISPTQAEKLFKAGKLSARQWERAKAQIVQPKGSPKLVPVEDKREELVIAGPDAFPVIEG